MEHPAWEPRLEAPLSSENWPNDTPIAIRKWMAARGMPSYESFKSFIDYSLKDLSDPLSLLGMDRAVSRLVEAFEKQEKICLYADFDMDGTPGLALLIRGMQHCGFQNLLSFQPHRFDDGYGVHKEIVDDLIENHGVQLFVTVDVGITAIDAVASARDKGVDFIITDHHQQKEVLPPAYAIVNPNQKECDSDLQHLCGTGVAFYLVLALRRVLQDKGLLANNFDPKKLLDCFAIGTLTDMVPLVRENRPLVQHGLLQLARTERLGIRALMERLNLGGKALSSSDVAISLAPKLNALGRMNSSLAALDLFLESDPKEALKKVEETMRAQEDRTRIQREGQVKIDQNLEGQRDLQFVFEYSEDFYKGIVGLLATQTTNRLNVASFVGALIDGKIKGSARAPKGMNLLEAFEHGKEFLHSFGGHERAAGFELDLSQADNFRNSLQDFYQDFEIAQTRLEYDFEMELSELDKDFSWYLKKLEPFGMGFPIPLIRFNHLFVSSTKVLKEKHLKLVLKDLRGNKIDGLWFFADNIDEKRQLTSNRVCLVAEPSINCYMGRESLQLLIRDLKVEY